ncbi:oplophorus-luciferin 2-monooxygenase non-catalytic subunit-like [Penaeus japonicus]|uniref:oplophorus-luciferin 2-monooxygenase non-catalytic subunit-like n=1 Tax=Penaeus japonicus TaxID=27405 RepID=UPI001C70B4D5|nr:oplophorus-luciferin 2-monooxygenase non-catalytic subunit-like [Penaeus japonicus]XP_042892634.1 oplophorus-luciferin 2-monooxygenase non-catalytic subunit-like [Penaeus japonicus]
MDVYNMQKTARHPRGTTQCDKSRSRNGTPLPSRRPGPRVLPRRTRRAHLPAGFGSRDLPCPAAEDISPCECVVGATYQMDMLCSFVVDFELARVFEADFPFKHFRRLELRNSIGLTVLQEGEFGAVKPSRRSWWTSRVPETLVVVSLSFNRISEIPVDGLKNVPNIEDFHFQGNNLQYVYPGTFSGLQSLRRLDLLKSNLKNIPERTFEFSSSSFRELVLTSSNISNIEPNAIKGLKAGSLWLNGNLLKGLDESAFRPILTEVGSLYLAGNPLSCGCDIAWLVTRPSLLAKVADDATCSNGQLLADLDPAISCSSIWRLQSRLSIFLKMQ